MCFSSADRSDPSVLILVDPSGRGITRTQDSLATKIPVGRAAAGLPIPLRTSSYRPLTGLLSVLCTASPSPLR